MRSESSWIWRLIGAPVAAAAAAERVGKEAEAVPGKDPAAAERVSVSSERTGLTYG